MHCQTLQKKKNYSTYDRELLVAYESIKYFKNMVEKREFVIRTNLKILTYAFQQKAGKSSPRQLRRLDFIDNFSQKSCILPITIITVTKLIDYSSLKKIHFKKNAKKNIPTYYQQEKFDKIIQQICLRVQILNNCKFTISYKNY